MDWAFGTRFQADRDLMVEGGFRTLPLDASLNGARVGAKAGFDLTWPFGMQGRLETTVPEPPKFKGERFASVRAALEHGPKYFEELMAAVGSRDGREVVRDIDAIRREAGISRDERGRYMIGKP
jgi:3-polyprenyl-4-hydroxybenzoate decarboxylase